MTNREIISEFFRTTAPKDIYDSATSRFDSIEHYIIILESRIKDLEDK